MSALKLTSLNIERSKHLDEVEPFLATERPDVACFQELVEKDIPLLAAAMGAAAWRFFPMTRLINEQPGALVGTGIFSTLPMPRGGAAYYAGNDSAVPRQDVYDSSTFNDENRAALWCDAEKEGETFRIATTHFTWTPKGNPSGEQRRDMAKLLHELEGLGEFVLCGDFNAPRTYQNAPGEIFSLLAARYRDNIPLRYETSIDVEIHRAGKLRPQELKDKMVDGLFSTTGYACSGVELRGGISDHLAIVATVTKNDVCAT